MNIELFQNNVGYEEVLNLLKENHPEYKIIINSSNPPKPKYETSNFIAKIGNKYYEASDPNDLYAKIVDHFFKIPHCFIG